MQRIRLFPGNIYTRYGCRIISPSTISLTTADIHEEITVRVIPYNSIAAKSQAICNFRGYLTSVNLWIAASAEVYANPFVHSISFYAGSYARPRQLIPD